MEGVAATADAAPACRVGAHEACDRTAPVGATASHCATEPAASTDRDLFFELVAYGATRGELTAPEDANAVAVARAKKSATDSDDDSDTPRSAVVNERTARTTPSVEKKDVEASELTVTGAESADGANSPTGSSKSERSVSGRHSRLARAAESEQAVAAANIASQSNIHRRNVYLSGLPPHFTSADFRSLCTQFGRVEALKVKIDATCTPTKGYGFALYYSEESAAACVRGLHGSFLSGRRLQARYADAAATPQAVDVDAAGVACLHPPLMRDATSRRATATTPHGQSRPPRAPALSAESTSLPRADVSAARSAPATPPHRTNPRGSGAPPPLCAAALATAADGEAVGGCGGGLSPSHPNAPVAALGGAGGMTVVYTPPTPSTPSYLPSPPGLMAGAPVAMMQPIYAFPTYGAPGGALTPNARPGGLHANAAAPPSLNNGAPMGTQIFSSELNYAAAGPGPAGPFASLPPGSNVMFFAPSPSPTSNVGLPSTPSQSVQSPSQGLAPPSMMCMPVYSVLPQGGAAYVSSIPPSPSHAGNGPTASTLSTNFTNSTPQASLPLASPPYGDAQQPQLFFSPVPTPLTMFNPMLGSHVKPGDTGSSAAPPHMGPGIYYPLSQ